MGTIIDRIIEDEYNNKSTAAYRRHSENVKIKLLDDYAKIPTRGTSESAGYDLYTINKEETKIESGETVMLETGIALQLPDGYFGAIFPRSGLATKRGLSLINSVGVIDSDYRGQIMVGLHNYSNETQYIAPGERIAQLILLKYDQISFIESDKLVNTKRGEGGFGSTGIN